MYTFRCGTYLEFSFRIKMFRFGVGVGFSPTSSPSFIPYFPLSPYLPTLIRGFFSFVALHAAFAVIPYFSLLHLSLLSGGDVYIVLGYSPWEWSPFFIYPSSSLYRDLVVSTSVANLKNPLLIITVAACGHH